MRALIWQSVILLGAFLLVYALAAAIIVALSLVTGAPGAGLGLSILLIIAAIPFVIFVYVRTSLAAPAIVLENLSGWRGLVRSWNLARGFGWRTTAPVRTSSRESRRR